MTKTCVKLIILSIILTPFFLLYFLNTFVNSSKLLSEPTGEFDWIKNGFKNFLGYSTIILPAYLTYIYLRKIQYLDKSNGLSARIFRMCFVEPAQSLLNDSPTGSPTGKKSYWTRTFLLIFYFVMLQVTYLTWGILQEKVMTRVYENREGKLEYFGDSQFLVFVNRVLAFSISGAILLCRQGFRHKCPLYKYIFCSLSNITSSWCQYEALKYVSFPHQVLAKAGKMIPVMVMGKLLSRTQYKYYEYITSIFLSIGMLCFMMDVGNDRATTTVTTISGACLLILYIAFDSFTSNWQSVLFKKYSLSPIQMMCFVNLFSFILTGTALVQQSNFYSSLGFLVKYPMFSVDCLLLSLFSAVGQLLIFSTIAEFGPLVFVIISTIRQCLSVLLSCILYQHEIHALGVFGLGFVFWSVFLRIYWSYKKEQKRIKKLNTGSSESQNL